MVIYTCPLRPSIPYLQFTYSESAFKAVLEQWGDAGKLRFRAHFAIDFPFLVSYGVFGYLLAKSSPLFARLSTSTRQWLSWCMPAAALLDALENLLHLYLSSGAPSIPSPLYLTAGIVATSKWLLIVIFLISAGAAWLKNRQITAK